MKFNKIFAAMAVAVICGFNSFDAVAGRGSVKGGDKVDARGASNKSSNNKSTKNVDARGGNSNTSTSTSKSSSTNRSSSSTQRKNEPSNSHLQPAKKAEPVKRNEPVKKAEPVKKNNNMQRAPQSHLDGNHSVSYASTKRYTPTVRHSGSKHVYHHKIHNQARVFYIDNAPYYTYNGVYYRYVSGYGYEEIYMPENVIVSDLPYGANRVYINGYRFYEADGMWFQPVYGGFLIVAPPLGSSAAYVAKPSYYYSATFGF